MRGFQVLLSWQALKAEAFRKYFPGFNEPLWNIESQKLNLYEAEHVFYQESGFLVATLLLNSCLVA